MRLTERALAVRGMPQAAKTERTRSSRRAEGGAAEGGRGVARVHDAAGGQGEEVERPVVEGEVDSGGRGGRGDGDGVAGGRVAGVAGPVVVQLGVVGADRVAGLGVVGPARETARRPVEARAVRRGCGGDCSSRVVDRDRGTDPLTVGGTGDDAFDAAAPGEREVYPAGDAARRHRDRRARVRGAGGACDVAVQLVHVGPAGSSRGRSTYRGRARAPRSSRGRRRPALFTRELLAS